MNHSSGPLDGQFRFGVRCPVSEVDGLPRSSESWVNLTHLGNSIHPDMKTNRLWVKVISLLLLSDNPILKQFTIGRKIVSDIL